MDQPVDPDEPDAGDIIDSITFTDSAAIETLQRDGTIRRWDVATGAELPR